MVVIVPPRCTSTARRYYYHQGVLVRLDVLVIPYVRGLNEEKGLMRRVEPTGRGLEAEEFAEEGVQLVEEDSRPRKPNKKAQTDKTGLKRSLVSSW